MSDARTWGSPLAGRRLVVTGLGGIGVEVARLALAAGAGVHAVDVDAGSLERHADDLGIGWTVADLTDDAATERALGRAATSLGGLDALVAVAGGSGRSVGDGPVEQLTASAIRGTLDRNALPALLALGAFVRLSDPATSRGAVLVSSVLARHPNPGFATHAYALAKAGIEGLTRAAASLHAADRIQVNAVAPGLTRTPMSRRAQGDEAARAFAKERQPLTEDGFVDPSEVASACVWLLSTRQVTGQVIDVDGGWGVC